MDLGAYAQIEDLGDILGDNNIEIARLRGLRLMKNEKPVSDEKLKEMIADEQTAYAINWIKQRNDWCWSSSRDRYWHKSFIYGKDKNGYDEVIGVDFTKVHGKLRKHIKFAWKKIVKAYTAQYEMFNKYAGKNVLYVHARQGGGNRPWYPIDTKHPMYLSDVDDAWDSTYCDIYYDLDKSVAKGDNV